MRRSSIAVLLEIQEMLKLLVEEQQKMQKSIKELREEQKKLREEVRLSTYYTLGNTAVKNDMAN